mmetsp:Transcript_21294/g.24456  ORF Transcript_21294/g.24456 Transcript_21294/m.24456 type:complete len:92 (-) Transcript_21294:1223-1498(-)
MDYPLFPHHSLPIPHIIISSYAANDAQQPDVEGHFWYEEVPHFIQAAKNVRPCEEQLPLVVLADHMCTALMMSPSTTNSRDIMRCSRRGTI